ISWGSWFLYAAPWAVIMSVILYFVMTRLIKPDASEIEGKGNIKQQLDNLGAITTNEKRLIIVSLFLLFFWSTEGIVHPFDSTTVTIVALAYMFIPKIGVFSWSEVQPKIAWGTLIIFAIGISMGQVLLATDGASCYLRNRLRLLVYMQCR